VQKAGVTPPGRLMVLWQYIRRHLAARTDVTPQADWRYLASTSGDSRQRDTKSDFPRRLRGTSTVHWKHLATKLVARRLLLTCSGAGSLSSVQKPAGPYEGFGRRNQDLLVQKAGVTPPGRLMVLWQYIRRHLATRTDVTPQETRSSEIQRKSDILRQEGRYSDSTVKYKEKQHPQTGRKVLWQYIGNRHLAARATYLNELKVLR